MGDTCTLIYSGGSDSFTLLHFLLANGYDVHALTFDYGQRHKKEIGCAQQVTEKLGIPHVLFPIDLSTLSPFSALTHGQPVPEGHYAHASMTMTVVPNRNMVLLSLAAAYALAHGHHSLAYGAHQGDHEIYPDCRPEFILRMGELLRIADWNALQLLTPFMIWSKKEIYAWGRSNGLDYGQTWTCYNGRALACGRCGSCVERLEAFYNLGMDDPLEYEDRDFFRTVTQQAAA